MTLSAIAGQAFTAQCVCLALVAACICGCVTRPVYHDAWAARVNVEPGACPPIDGEYSDAGEAYTRTGNGGFQRHARSLAEIFNVTLNSAFDDGTIEQVAFADAPVRDTRTVRLHLAGNTLQVKATFSDGGTTSFDLPVQKRCRDSILILAAVRDSTGDSAFAVTGKYVTALGRTEDGSLLVRKSETEAGFFWLLPLGVTSHGEWMMFPLAPPDATQSQPPAQ